MSKRHITYSNPCTCLLQAQRAPEVWGSQVSRQSAREGGKVVSCTHRPPLSKEVFVVLIFVRVWVEPRYIVWPDVLCHTIGIQTHDHQACSAVPQPSAPTACPNYTVRITSKTFERVAEFRCWGVVVALHLHRNYDLINLWQYLLSVQDLFAFPLLSFKQDKLKFFILVPLVFWIIHSTTLLYHTVHFSADGGHFVW
jgi:hypothetical protein